MDATGPALVLGSAQPFSQVDAGAARAAAVEVVRRRSGGGAVYVSRSAVVWVDVVVPNGDDLWDADVGRATWWLGDAWARALVEIGVEGPIVWKAGMRSSPWSERVCFAGVGPGEVLVGGAKAVGLSQRRTRTAALFQAAVLLEWEPRRLLDLLALDPAEREAGYAELSGVATGIGAGAGRAVFEALTASLPD
jgi:lipoate-protein ligase A